MVRVTRVWAYFFSQMNRTILLFGYLRWRVKKRLPRLHGTAFRTLFAGYASLDSMWQHRQVARSLESSNTTTMLYIPSGGTLKGKVPNPPSGVYDYHEKLTLLSDISPSSGHIRRGLMDSYRRRCHPKEFFVKTSIDENLWFEVVEMHMLGAQAANRFDCGVITDGAYAFNRTFWDHMVSNGKPTFILNPGGRFSDVSSPSLEVLERPDLKAIYQSTLRMAPDDWRALQEASKAFVESEMSGAAKSGCTPTRKLETNREQDQIDSFVMAPSNVLFLHCFRDAADYLPGAREEGFGRDYFEWADQVFGIVSEDPKNWVIRKHPYSFLYPDEDEILATLLAKHNLQPSSLQGNETIHQLIQRGATIVTHSGTVALEAAALGNCAIVASNYFELVGAIVVKDSQGLEQAIRASATQPLVATSEQQDLAAICLYLMGPGQDANGLTLGTSVRPTLSTRQAFADQIRVLKSIKRSSMDPLSNLVAKGIARRIALGSEGKKEFLSPS